MSKPAAVETATTSTTVSNLDAGCDYGYPVARFDPTPITIAGRTVFVSAILWDAPYGYFRADGHYAKKDGTCGSQIAKPLMGEGEVPPAVLAALEPLI